MSRLVAVSNRTPGGGGLSPSGGLVVALSAVMRAQGGLWFGWSGHVQDAVAERAELREEGAVVHARIDLSTDEHTGFYLGYSNRVLWPLCHGFAAACERQAEYHRTYQQVNQRYASALLPLLRADDRIWVQDYHLLPLGRYLRAAGVAGRIGFFLHVPFPDIESLRTLDDATEWVRALQAYDIVGFQTQRDLDAFVRALHWACPEVRLEPGGLWRADGGVTEIGVFPIGIDVPAITDEVRASRDAPRVVEARALRHRHSLLVAAERLVASKGLEHRLRAYQAYLSEATAATPAPLLLQIAVPPRREASLDPPLTASARRWAAQIDAPGGDPAEKRLRWVFESVPHAELMGILRAAHVGLVTPLRDGMNLVAKEFVAAQDPDDPGMLVLSVHAGAARQLEAALQVDPYDTGAVAKALKQALGASQAERRERHQAMLRAIARQDLTDWSRSFLDRLGRCRSG